MKNNQNVGIVPTVIVSTNRQLNNNMPIKKAIPYGIATSFAGTAIIALSSALTAGLAITVGAAVEIHKVKKSLRSEMEK